MLQNLSAPAEFTGSETHRKERKGELSRKGAMIGDTRREHGVGAGKQGGPNPEALCRSLGTIACYRSEETRRAVRPLPADDRSPCPSGEGACEVRNHPAIESRRCSPHVGSTLHTRCKRGTVKSTRDPGSGETQWVIATFGVPPPLRGGFASYTISSPPQSGCHSSWR